MRKLFCGICLAILLAGNALALDATGGIQVDTLVQSECSWDGNPLPAYPAGAPEITILRIKVPPGAQLPLHEHPVINAGVLLSGELTVVTESNETLHLKAGEPIIEVVDKWHYGKNEGTIPVDIIVFYAGIQDRPITVKK